MFAAIKDGYQGFKYTGDVRVAYCMYLGCLPEPMALYNSLGNGVAKVIETGRAEKLPPEETALLIVCKALAVVFEQINDKHVLKDAITQVYSTEDFEALPPDALKFEWFSGAYDRIKKGVFTMPDGMTMSTLVVGFAFWMARKMQRDGKIKPEAATIMIDDITLLMWGVTDPEERRKRRLNKFVKNMFPEPAMAG